MRTHAKQWDYEITATRRSDGKVMMITTHVGKASALMEMEAIDRCFRDARIVDLRTNRAITRDQLEGTP